MVSSARRRQELPDLEVDSIRTFVRRTAPAQLEATERRPGTGKSPQRVPSAATDERAASANLSSSLPAAGYRPPEGARSEKFSFSMEGSCSSAFESAAVCASSARHQVFSGSSRTQCSTASTAEDWTQEALSRCLSDSFRRSPASKKAQHMEHTEMWTAQSLHRTSAAASNACVVQTLGHPSPGLAGTGKVKRTPSRSASPVSTRRGGWERGAEVLDVRVRKELPVSAHEGPARPRVSRKLVARSSTSSLLTLSPPLRRSPISSLTVPGETVAMFRFFIYAFNVCICLVIYCNFENWSNVKNVSWKSQSLGRRSTYQARLLRYIHTYTPHT